MAERPGSGVEIGEHRGPPLGDEECATGPRYFVDYPFFRRLSTDGGMSAIRTCDRLRSMHDFRFTEVDNALLTPRAARYQANFALLDGGGRRHCWPLSGFT